MPTEAFRHGELHMVQLHERSRGAHSQSFWDDEEGKAGRTIDLVVPTLPDHTFCVWRQHKHGYLLISYLEGESWGAPDLKFYRDLFYDLKQRQCRWNLLDYDMKENKFSVCKIQAVLFMSTQNYNPGSKRTDQNQAVD